MKRRNLGLALLFLTFPSTAVAVAGTPAAASAAPTAHAPDPVVASVLGAMDRTADPCQDFYRYACGGWIDSTKLPADQSRWSRSFSVIHEHNRELVRDILEKAAADPGGDPDRARIGNFYASCMDQKAIEAAGIHPLEPYLAEIAKVDGPKSLLTTAGHLYRNGIDALFRLRVSPDAKNPGVDIAVFGQGGLGMPERDYYVSTDPRKKALLAAYEKHVAKMLGLLGESSEDAAAHAAGVVAFETTLAQASRPRAELRLPEKLYHKIDIEGLEKLTPKLPWKSFLEATGYPALTQINVATPEFFTALEKAAVETDPAVLREYLRWQLVRNTSEALPARFVDASFDFYGKELAGQKEIQPRWKRCVRDTERALGQTLGKIYVETQFPGDSKKIAREMIHDIESAFAANLPNLSWMDDTTRTRALEKMEAISNKVGYPDKWRDYSSMKIERGNFFNNVLAGERFEFKRQADKVGRAVDRNEWRMTPQTVNAYYNPLINEIVFPAGILQPPFFRRDFPAAMNYGAIGAVVGHELTHGFDDQGRKFDPQGRLREWWEPAVAAKFEKQTQCVDQLYSSYQVEPGVHVQGKLTMGENIADIGGVKEAYSAFQSWKKRHPGGEPAVSGLTDDQLFFVAFGQVWCSESTPEAARLRVTTDPHSPPQFRVLGAVTNNPAFAQAFQCPVGSPMNPEKRCLVW